jgi:hypothetical protein
MITTRRLADRASAGCSVMDVRSLLPFPSTLEDT